MSTICNDCGEEYINPSSHWSRSDECTYPDLDPWKIETIQGVLLGDGCITYGPKHAYFIASMTNKKFLQYLDDELGWLTSGVSKHESQQEVGCKTKYRLQGMATPHMSTLRGKWYQDGEKQIPKDQLTRREVKLWYVCDGCMAWSNSVRRPSPRFTIISLEDQKHILVETLNEEGIEAVKRKDSVAVPADHTDEFLDWLGEPLPGFEYKWENGDYNRYRKLRSKV